MSSDIPLPAIMVAGFNQTKKHIKAGTARRAYAAFDAETKIISCIRELCAGCGIEFDDSKSKSELAALCSIDVDCASCVELK